jgi:hypothetical protein
MSIFSQVAKPNLQRNTFDLSHDKKFSAKIGQLTPIMISETVPGDSFNIKTSSLLRFAPMIAPIMHKASVYTHFFFVPNRILWSNWESFITGGEDGLADPTFPYFEPNGDNAQINAGDLADYMGLPIGDISGTQYNALPFAAYSKIYNDYYRDQNLIQPLDDVLNDGYNVFNIFKEIQLRAWQHDYFTSALPFTQRGPEATIPLGNITEASFIDPNGQFPANVKRDLEMLSPTVSNTADLVATVNNLPGISTAPIQLDTDPASINDLRRAFRLQEFLEKNARGGSRYIEIIMSHFGVKSSDSRLQRPEFLGGSQTPVTISEVLQTSDASAQDTPQGNMAGHGVSAGTSGNINYRCEEHGFIIGIMSVMPKSAYQQGIPKLFSKFDKFDYFWPSFANIGEQPILNQELYHEAGSSLNDDIFGYTPRYAEYKYIPSSVHGEMKTTLNFWHMGRIFNTRPLLNQDFIECDPTETDRIFAVSDSENLYVYLHNEVKASRPMPYFGTPTI